MYQENIHSIVEFQRKTFLCGTTRSKENRIYQLKSLKKCFEKYEDQLYEALKTDLHKSKDEAFLTEMGIVHQELNNAIKHVGGWMKTRRAKGSLTTFPSNGYIVNEPLGCALIIAPWNYPVNLTLTPLIGALAAGCTAILKPSPYSPHVSAVLSEMIKEAFQENIVAIIEGHRDVNEMLLNEKFDIIFFTGSPALGRVVAAAASKNLTPCILELGGKSPCIVDREADIKMSAKRIMWGKCLNAGQTCIAPDYLLVHKEVKDALFAEMEIVVKNFYGEHPEKSKYYPKIVHKASFERLKRLMESGGNIVFGGDCNEDELYIAPTLIDNVSFSDPIMQQEIFGPLLPVITFENIEKVIEDINAHEKPLAFYYFGEKRKGWNVIKKTTSGGACINNTIMHIANSNMPFGGVGNSGMGRYHGKESFLAFTNQRSVLQSYRGMDFGFKYPPFRWLNLFKWLLK